MVDASVTEDALFPERVGDVLRAARVKAGLDLADIAGKTRVPLRFLEAIESSNYKGLPPLTYVTGFVKAYARSVGADETEMARGIRSELAQEGVTSWSERVEEEEIDPSRVPSSRLAWLTAVAAVLVAVGYIVWRGSLGDGHEAERETPAAASEAATPANMPAASGPQTAQPAAPATGEVVLTARQNVWVRIYDRNDKVLFQKEMAAGERFAVPADADGPMIRTGRPELIDVTVGGRQVAPLGAPERTIKDVGISAAALAARTAAPSATAGPAPAGASGTGQAPAAARATDQLGAPLTQPAPAGQPRP